MPTHYLSRNLPIRTIAKIPYTGNIQYIDRQMKKLHSLIQRE